MKLKQLSIFLENAPGRLYEALRALGEAGINCTRTVLATTKAMAVSIGEEIGYPVVLKVSSVDISHKSDAGGVKVNLKSRAEVEKASNWPAVKASMPVVVKAATCVVVSDWIEVLDSDWMAVVDRLRICATDSEEIDMVGPSWS